MHPAPGQPNDDDHCCDTRLIFSAAKLDVYRHEQMANTEPPRKKPGARINSKGKSALLKAMATWALAHF